MDFSALPPELKLNVIEHLEPVPTLHFALTSKEHLRLSKDCLKEHAMFAKYSVIQTTYDGHLIWEFTKEVLLNPRLGWYVRELNLIVGRTNENETVSEEDKILFQNAAKELLPLYPNELGFFATEEPDPGDLETALETSITQGSEDAILTILVHNLPQLRILRMADTRGRDSGSFMQFMRRVAAGYQNPVLAPGMPLKHLDSVVIAHSDTEFCCDIAWAVYFLCVPSLRTFAAYMMGSEGVGEFQGGEESEDEVEAGEDAHLRMAGRVPVSNVEELLFVNCQFDPQSFNMILPMIKNLKRFYYQAAGHHVAYQDYEPRKVIKALSTQTSHSLEELYLSECEVGFEEGENDIPFVSARGFKKLKALVCETRWLLPLPDDSDFGNGEALSQGFHTAEEEEAEAMTDPRDNLPDSLEYLCLSGVYESDEWYKLADLFDTTNPNTPKLTDDNILIKCGSDTSFGGAVDPQIRFANPHVDYEVLRNRLNVY